MRAHAKGRRLPFVTATWRPTRAREWTRPRPPVLRDRSTQRASRRRLFASPRVASRARARPKARPAQWRRRQRRRRCGGVARLPPRRRYLAHVDDAAAPELCAPLLGRAQDAQADGVEPRRGERAMCWGARSTFRRSERATCEGFVRRSGAAKERSARGSFDGQAQGAR